MIELNANLNEIPNYKAYVMAGNDMSPTINEGDHVVIDLAQRFIRSGDIYVVEYKNSIIVCRLLLDRDKVKLIFDGASYALDELVDAITVIGRVIETKTLHD
ncbi:MAG: S24/S26 family peptidase [Gammaproteobacteria bacterium]|nr:S24/S26 family peptidase [Gammaproteobacteria bacterium]